MDDFFDDLQRTPRVPNVDNSTTETENVSNSQEPGVNEEGNLNKDSNGASQQTSVDGTIENQSTSLKREDSKVKDVAAIKGMLSEMGVSHYEPEVVDSLLEYAYKYMHSVLDDARLYSRHAKKTEMDVSDIKLALQLRAGQDVVQPVPRELMSEVAKKKNSVALPQVKSGLGLRLPTDRYCLIQPNYKLKHLPVINTATRAESSKPYVRHHSRQQALGGQSNAEYQKAFRPMSYQSPLGKQQQQPPHGQTINVTPHTRHQFHSGAMNSPAAMMSHPTVHHQQHPPSQQISLNSAPVHFSNSPVTNNPR